MPDAISPSETLHRRAEQATAVLDAVNVVAALLQPFCGSGSNHGFVAVTDRGVIGGDKITEDGFRILPAIVRAIDKAIEIEAESDYDDTCLDLLETFVPLRWGLHALERAHFHQSPDFPVPEGAASILDFSFDQVRTLAGKIRAIVDSLEAEGGDAEA